jgi:hypothetical protein
LTKQNDGESMRIEHVRPWVLSSNSWELHLDMKLFTSQNGAIFFSFMVKTI